MKKMHSHKKIVNIICVLIAMLSLMTAFAVRAEEEPETTTAPSHATEATTEAPTSHTRSHKATEPTTEETEPPNVTEKTDGSYIDYEPKPDEKTSRTEEETEPDTTEEISKHETGTKSTRAALYETTTTSTTTAVEKNINDYGKKYGWMKWICYVFLLGSVAALIVYNVKCHQLKAGTAGQGSARSRSVHSGSDIRSTSRTATKSRNQRNDRNGRR